MQKGLDQKKFTALAWCMQVPNRLSLKCSRASEHSSTLPSVCLVLALLQKGRQDDSGGKTGR